MCLTLQTHRPSLLPVLFLLSFLLQNWTSPLSKFESPKLNTCVQTLLCSCGILSKVPKGSLRSQSVSRTQASLESCCTAPHGGASMHVDPMLPSSPPPLALGSGGLTPSVHPTHDPPLHPSTSYEWVELYRTLQSPFIWLPSCRDQSLHIPQPLLGHQESRSVSLPSVQAPRLGATRARKGLHAGQSLGITSTVSPPASSPPPSLTPSISIPSMPDLSEDN